MPTAVSHPPRWCVLGSPVGAVSSSRMFPFWLGFEMIVMLFFCELYVCFVWLFSR